MTPRFDLILRHVPPPHVEAGKPFTLLATTLEANPYLGRVLTGRVLSGTVRPNMAVRALSRDGRVIETGRISKVLAFRGLERQPIEQGEAGDIVAISGLSKATVADPSRDLTVDPANPAPPYDTPNI